MGETKKIESDDIEESKAPLMAHLLELRSRLIKCVLAILIGCIICIPFLDEIVKGLMVPFEMGLEKHNDKLIKNGKEIVDLGLIATNPLETFFVQVKIAVFGGLILGFRSLFALSYYVAHSLCLGRITCFLLRFPLRHGICF